VEGETLQERLARGRIPLEDALPIARQIAEALEEAHEHGIVHRDLKPANVKLTPEGKVKVLDFGLARAFGGDGEASPSDTSRSPTLTREGTEAGVILGSAAYMSPEQARGRRVDRRADIWAFGVVLFEMLTGRRLFQGETVTDTLAAVLKTEPEWGLLPAETPPRVRELLRRCLERDPRQRLRDIGDARLELEPAVDMNQRIDAVAAPMPQLAHRLGLLVVAALLGGVALGVLVMMGRAGLRGEAAPSQRTWLEIAPPRQRFAFQPAPSISPDGRQVTFWAPDDSGKLGLWVRSLDAPAARLLPGTSWESRIGDWGCAAPFWSPDGRSLAFFAEGKLKRTDLDGGAPLTLADASNPRGGSWSPDGVIVFVPIPGRGAFRISASGGEPTRLPLPGLQVAWPHFLPDGRHLLLSDSESAQRGVVLATLDGTEVRLLSGLETRAEYSGGFLFFGNKGSLFAQPFEPQKRRLSGEPVRVADDLGFSFGEMSAYAFSVSRRGTLVYWSGPLQPLNQLTWFSRSGQRLGTVGEPDEIVGFALSPANDRLVVERHDAKRSAGGLWLVETATGVSSSLPSPVGWRAWFGATPVWAPSGDRVLFATFPGVWEQSLRGGTPERISDLYGWLLDVSADGTRVLLNRDDAETNADLWVLPLDGDRRPRACVRGKQREWGGRFSPDGQWITYLSDESGRFEAYVQSFPENGRPLRVSRDGATFAEWRGDGRELYYGSPDGTVMVASIETAGGASRVSAPRALFRAPTMFEPARRQLWASADGQRFLVSARVEDSTRQALTVLLDWRPASRGTERVTPP